MGKITSLEQLPPDEEFIGMVKEAMLLNESGIKIKREKAVGNKPKVSETPDYFFTGT